MRNRNSEFTPRSRMKFDGRQGGAALVVGLLVTTVMSLVAVNASKQTVVQQRMATNYRFSIEAMNNADSGSLTAFNQINAQGLILNGFNDELDLNGNGEVDEDELNRDNAFASWTPNLVRGVYNYLFVAKDPGAFAHNSNYAMQLLYDSLESLGGDVSAMNRPPIEED